jgi:hypothetical protein
MTELPLLKMKGPDGLTVTLYLSGDDPPQLVLRRAVVGQPETSISFGVEDTRRTGTLADIEFLRQQLLQDGYVEVPASFH